MSTCISARGEYSSHTTGDDYRCDYCGVFDEDGALEDLASLRRQLSRATAEALREAADEVEAMYFGGGNVGSANAWGAKQAGKRLRARAEHAARCPHPKCPGGSLCCCCCEAGVAT